MATSKEVRRAVKAADRRTQAKSKAANAMSKSISSSKTNAKKPEDCCTPSMAGKVLSKLGAKARRKSEQERRRVRAERATARRGRKNDKSAKKPEATSPRPDPAAINRALVGSGWKITELTLNDVKGFVRLVVEQTDLQTKRGRKVTLLRSGYTGRTVVVRDITELRPGMYRDFWTVVDSLGQSRHDDLKAGVQALSEYIADNSKGKSLATVAGLLGPIGERRRVPLTIGFEESSSMPKGSGGNASSGKPSTAPRTKGRPCRWSDEETEETREALDFMIQSYKQGWGERRAWAKSELESIAEECAWTRKYVAPVLAGKGVPTEAQAKRAEERDASRNAAATARAEAVGNTAPRRRARSPKGAKRSRPESSSAPIRIDDLLRDLKDSAKDGYVERKHVAKALRKMLHARLKGGFSVKTPSHSMATTLDVQAAKGSRFTDAHRSALLDLFGEDGGRSNVFMVLVSPFVSDSSSVPTGVRADYADEFRALVAGAAGLPKPKPYAPPQKSQPAANPPARMESGLTDDDLQRLASLLLIELKAEGVDATAKRDRRRGTILVESGETRLLLGRTHRGFDVTRVWTKTPIGPKVLDVLESRVAPVFALGKPTSTTHKLIYGGLPASRREANWKREVSKWGPKLIRVEDVPSGPAANEKPPRHLQAVKENSDGSKAGGVQVEKSQLVTVAGLLADKLTEAGFRARRRAALRNGRVVLDLPSHGGFQGFAAIGPDPSGFDFMAGQLEHPGSEVARELFTTTFAPLLGDRPTVTGSLIRFKGYSAERIRDNIDAYIRGASRPRSTSGKTLSVGREDFEERREARVDRLRGRAAKAQAESDSRRELALRDLPDFGEPIKVDHYSAKRHRKMLERSDVNMRKSIEEHHKAKHYASRARSAEKNAEISSDDPKALIRLSEKLQALEAQREDIKRKNKLARAGRLPSSANPTVRGVGKMYPTASYVLTNLGAEIRRVKERIEQLSKRQGRVAREVERGGVRVVENGEVSRVQVFHDDIPSKEHRAWLKQHGFRWARSEQAWQRKLGDSAWNLAMRYLDELVEAREDTPYASVETAAAKPNFTPKDLAFWRDEFAALDQEHPGEFTDDVYEAVKQSFRERKAGVPSQQAGAYAQYRLGNWTVEEAVRQMYAGRRMAKPKPRPRRRAKSTASSMSVDDFVEAVRKATSAVEGMVVLRVSSLGGRDSVSLNHYTVPEGTTDPTRLSNNRLLLVASGWGRDGEPPKNGKVQLRVQISRRGLKMRGRTAPPEKLVSVVVQMLEKHAAVGMQ